MIQSLGQQAIARRLQQQCDEGTVCHAYLFCGREGVGKTTLANAFARELTGGSEADITVVNNELYQIKASALSVDAIRAARRDMFVRPYVADYRVFVIPQADTMTASAQNALLKVLEEPPGYCVIILIAQKEYQLLDTIRSRVRTMRFPAVPDGVVAAYLQDKGLVADPAVLGLAGGSLTKAAQLAGDAQVGQLLEQFLPMAQQLTGDKIQAVYKLMAFFEKEKAHSPLLFDALVALFRESLLNHGEKRDTMNVSGLSPGAAAKAISRTEQAKAALLFNANYTVVVSELLLDIWEAIHD